jgi:hypothetical protein
MELLLNLAWLLLALPAYWLWRDRKVSRGFSSLQCLLALGCVLAILFPVISATDDLRAMRAEMEESSASKRSLRQGSGDRASLWSAAGHSAAATPSSTYIFYPSNDQSWQLLSRACLLVPTAPVMKRPSRAPPRFLLG